MIGKDQLRIFLRPLAVKLKDFLNYSTNSKWLSLCFPKSVDVKKPSNTFYSERENPLELLLELTSTILDTRVTGLTNHSQACLFWAGLAVTMIGRKMQWVDQWSSRSVRNAGSKRMEIEPTFPLEVRIIGIQLYWFNTNQTFVACKTSIYVIGRLGGPHREKLWPRSWKCCPRPQASGSIFNTEVTRCLQTIREKNKQTNKQTKNNERTSEYLLDKEKCIIEQIYFELLDVSSI